MEGRHRIRVVRKLAECKHHIRYTPVLVPVLREWADAMFSLVQLSGEHRHNGLIVTNVGPGSQAARAGIVRGDVLLRYDGVELDSAAALKRLTKRKTQGAEASRGSRTSTIEAARGPEDVSFEISGGDLGITVCPSLFRLKRVRMSPQKRQRTEAGAERTLAEFQTPPRGRRHDPSRYALVEVPGELARNVLVLAKALHAPGTSRVKKMAKALLSAVQP